MNKLKNLRRMKMFSLLFLLTFLTGTAFDFLNGVLTFNGTVVIAGSEKGDVLLRKSKTSPGLRVRIVI